MPAPPEQIEPVVAPRPGHMALVLAAGVANGAVIDSNEYGQVAIRGKTRHIEQIARVDVESDPNDPERQVKKTTIRLKPATTLSLLAGDGTLIEMDGDDALLEFITSNKQALATYLNTKFSPMYEFDFAGMKPYLDRIRLKGKYPMYTAQKHVVAAIARGFQSRNSILLVGSMGVGKTFMGSTTAIAIASGAVKALQDDIADDQVILVVCPPHLIEKWKRELVSINPNIYVDHLKRHEDVKAFMSKARKIGKGIPKIGLIKRDMTKLGAGRELAVVWRDEPVALWRHDQATPEGYEDQARIIKKRVPKCPHCGCTVMQEKKGTAVPASENWLKSGKRVCSNCHTALWQEVRDRGSRPKKGQKYPSKNPRYRLDQYLKKQYPDRVYMLIWDEVHECANGDTGNGESFSRMAGLSKKVLAMTGTPFNGRSSSMFNIEYALNPRIRQRYPIGGAVRFSRKEQGTSNFQQAFSGASQRGRAESKWVADMGVRERVVEERPSYDKDSGVYTGTSTYERPYQEAPGISPLLVAEVLDHAIFFSLGDLGKALPRYEEIAYPVTMDADTHGEYERTRSLLKDYLIQRRWEGDTTFRGAYLQWSMGWPNCSFRPTDVIHNIKHPITGEKNPHIVTRIPSYGEERIYVKEQALIDLLTDELANNRPCVVYLRQTATRDIQPRIEKLIRQHVPNAVPYILKNTVSAEKREKVIENEVSNGVNIILCNPELVKTGLDLVFAPTLIFFEIVFNLSTQMQAAARSYRLNQSHEHCKTIYMFAEGTMEHTAVQLMSRKQRAAKLLTGDIGLTGLEALTEGEGGFEAALLDAIAKDDVLVNPSEMFKGQAGELDAEDAAFWNVEVEDIPDEVQDTPDPLLAEAIQLGGIVREDDKQSVAAAVQNNDKPQAQTEKSDTRKVQRFVRRYLDTVSLIHDVSKNAELQAKLLTAILHGVLMDDETRKIVGLLDADFPKYPVHEGQLTKWVRNWLKRKGYVFMGCEEEVAQKVVMVAKQAMGFEPLQLGVFGALQDKHEEQVQVEILDDLQQIQPRKAKPSNKRRKKTIDLMAIPEDETDVTTGEDPLARKQKKEADDTPQQLAMF